MRKESNLDMAVSKADALAGSRGFKEPHFIRIHKPLEILDFENRPNSRSPELWRELSNSENNGGLCRLEVRNSSQKSLLILGSIANILARRTSGCGEAAEREGFELSVRFTST
jgi:hypothetical protein